MCARRPPPSFTTVSTRSGDAGSNTPNYTLRGVRAAAYTAAQMRGHRRIPMSTYARSSVLTFALCLLLSIALLQAQRNAQSAAAATYITGVVQGAQGPEAGVRVISETKGLPTNFITITLS